MPSSITYCLAGCWAGGPPCGLAPGHPGGHQASNYRFGFTRNAEWLHCVTALPDMGAMSNRSTCGLTVTHYVTSMPLVKPHACPQCVAKAGAFLGLLPRTASDGHKEGPVVSRPW